MRRENLVGESPENRRRREGELSYLARRCRSYVTDIFPEATPLPRCEDEKGGFWFRIIEPLHGTTLGSGLSEEIAWCSSADRIPHLLSA